MTRIRKVWLLLASLASTPALAIVPCPGTVEYLPDKSYLIANAVLASGVPSDPQNPGCVTTQHFLDRSAKVYQITVNAGWIHTIKTNGGGTDRSTVTVVFSNKVTKRKLTYMMRNGRLIIS